MLGAKGIPATWGGIERHTEELINHGSDGFLFEPGGVDALASYMRKLVEYPSLSEKMGREGRVKAERRYSMDKYMQSLLEIYTGVLERH